MVWVNSSLTRTDTPNHGIAKLKKLIFFPQLLQFILHFCYQFQQNKKKTRLENGSETRKNMKEKQFF